MKEYSAGDIAQAGGIYTVIHPSHRVVHEITIEAGTQFPQCRICGKRVSFQLWRAAKKESLPKPQRKLLVPFNPDEGNTGLAN